MIASPVPEMVTALSVELGSISEATWMEAPVTSRICFILDPPLPIRDPHWLAGTIRRRVIGGLGTPLPPLFISWNWEHHWGIPSQYNSTLTNAQNTHILKLLLNAKTINYYQLSLKD